MTATIAVEPKWSWSCRAVAAKQPARLTESDRSSPRVGDVALVQVESIGHHTRIATAEGEKIRLYRDDVIAGVFGNRYATEAFEAEIEGTDNLHMLTDAGMIGTVLSRHRQTPSPTKLRFLGYLAENDGDRMNLKALRFAGVSSASKAKNILLVVGTGMNSGKTTTATKLVKALLRRGKRVAACKLTGSVCPRDRLEFSATGAQYSRDFSDYGFPSTYLASEEELLKLFGIMLADAEATDPDMVIMEIADGVLQRETMMLLGNEIVRSRTRGIVLAAPCAASALFGVGRIERYGHTVLAVSGCITNSPLFMREFAETSPVPIALSTADAVELAEIVAAQFRDRE